MTETICATVPRELARRTGPAQALIPMPEYRCNVTLRDGQADGLRIDAVPFIRSHRMRDFLIAKVIDSETSVKQF